jgi:hypothetical protein
MKKVISILPVFILLTGCSIFNFSNNAPVKKAFKITNTKLYGTLWNESYNKYHIISQDGGSEFKVPGGSIWCFGDTFKGTREKTGKPHFKDGAVNCSIAFQPNNSKPYPPNLKYLSDKNGVISPFNYIENENAKINSIWPLAGTYLNGKSYLYYTMIEKTGNGSWDFKHVGDGLAVSNKPLAHYTRIIKNDSWKFPVHPSSIVETKNWLYLYSIDNTSKHVQGAFLSRVKAKDVENPDAYEYFSGYKNSSNTPKFSSNIKNKKVMLNEVYGQTSVVWNDYLQKYILAASSSFWESQIIKFYVSDTPYGPWYNTKAEIKVPKNRQNKKVDLVYCAFFHPSLFEDNGEIMYLTYSLMLKNSGFDANCEMVKIVKS